MSYCKLYTSKLFQYNSNRVDYTRSCKLYTHCRVEYRSYRVEYTRCRFFSKAKFLQIILTLHDNSSDCNLYTCYRVDPTCYCNLYTRPRVDNTSCRHKHLNLPTGFQAHLQNAQISPAIQILQKSLYSSPTLWQFFKLLKGSIVFQLEM